MTTKPKAKHPLEEAAKHLRRFMRNVGTMADQDSADCVATYLGDASRQLTALEQRVQDLANPPESAQQHGTALTAQQVANEVLATTRGRMGRAAELAHTAYELACEHPDDANLNFSWHKERMYTNGVNDAHMSAWSTLSGLGLDVDNQDEDLAKGQEPKTPDTGGGEDYQAATDEAPGPALFELERWEWSRHVSLTNARDGEPDKSLLDLAEILAHRHYASQLAPLLDRLREAERERERAKRIWSARDRQLAEIGEAIEIDSRSESVLAAVRRVLSERFDLQAEIDAMACGDDAPNWFPELVSALGLPEQTSIGGAIEEAKTLTAERDELIARVKELQPAALARIAELESDEEALLSLRQHIDTVCEGILPAALTESDGDGKVDPHEMLVTALAAAAHQGVQGAERYTFGGYVGRDGDIGILCVNNANSRQSFVVAENSKLPHGACKVILTAIPDTKPEGDDA